MYNDTVQMLLDEQRELRVEHAEMRSRLAWLVGRHERDGSVPVSEIAALLGMDESDA